MKKTKKMLSLLLAMIMTISLSVNVMADFEAKKVEKLADDYTGKTVILHSNDVHGALEGYACIAALKSELESKGAEVILVDAGDFSQGTPYVSTTKGADAITMMNAVGYDVVTLGNHEFDFGYAQLKENLSKFTGKVLCADVQENGKAIYDGHYLYTAKSGMKIGFFGLETPETQTKVNPALIQGIKFLTKGDLYKCAQAEIDALKDADLVICLAHLGVDDESAPDGHRSVDLYANTKGIDLIIDGHSHTVMTAGENGESVQSTGTKFENVGVVVIDNATKAIEDRFLVPTEGLAKDEAVAAEAKKIIDRVDAEYNVVFAKSEVELNGAKAPGNRTEETNNGDLITDALVWSVLKEGALTVDDDHVVAITNGGGIRAAIKVGDVTKKDLNTVLPFGNTIAVVYVTGAELLEALEASTYSTPGAVGGYPQTKGIQFTLNTHRAYDKNEQTYPDSTYYGPKTIQRVKIESINGKPFSPTDTYAVVTNNFCAAGGDTYYAFKAASAQFDTGIVMDEAVMAYVEEVLDGVISAEKYAKSRGDQTQICFADLKEGAWYLDGVNYALENKIMNGVSEKSFDPNGTTTRGMIMTMLARMEGVDTTPAEGETWYAKGVQWAVESEISDGTNPTAQISRQELATMLYRYAQFKKVDVSVGEDTNILSYDDAFSISEWAMPAMQWACGAEIINGMGDGTLNPTGSATRAQVAKMLMAYQGIAA